MDKKVVIFLVVGLVVGYVAGYFTRQLSSPAPAAHTPATATAQPAAGMETASPEAEAQMAEFREQVQQLEQTVQRQPDNLAALTSWGTCTTTRSSSTRRSPTMNGAVKLDAGQSAGAGGSGDLPVLWGPAGARRRRPPRRSEGGPQPAAYFTTWVSSCLHGANDLKAGPGVLARLVATNTTAIDLETEAAARGHRQHDSPGADRCGAGGSARKVIDGATCRHPSDPMPFSTPSRRPSSWWAAISVWSGPIRRPWPCWDCAPRSCWAARAPRS